MSATETATRVHAHRCEACAKKGEEVIWIHPDTCKGVVQAHTCPKCGTVEWKQFMVQTGSLPQANRQGGINYETLLSYILLGFIIAFLSYSVFAYVKKVRNGKAQIPNIS